MSRDPLEGASPHDIDRPPSRAFAGAAPSGGSKLVFLLIVAGIAFGTIMGAAVYLGSKPAPVRLPLPTVSPSATPSPLATPLPVPTATDVPSPAPAATDTPSAEATADSSSSGREAKPNGAPSLHGGTN